jgi:hypothetical protein
MIEQAISSTVNHRVKVCELKVPVPTPPPQPTKHKKSSLREYRQQIFSQPPPRMI